MVVIRTSIGNLGMLRTIVLYEVVHGCNKDFNREFGNAQNTHIASTLFF